MRDGDGRGESATSRVWARRRKVFGASLAALFIVGLLASGAFGDVSSLAVTGSSTSSDSAAATNTTAAASDSTTTGTSSASVTYSPTIASDKADYPPGATVTITGAGWPAQDAIVVQTDDAIGKTWSNSGNVTSDDNGDFTYSFQLPNTFISDYTTTASDAFGLSATTTFTDAKNFQATLEGQQCVLNASACTGVGDNFWTSQQLQCSPTPCTGWRELDSIPTRVLFENGPSTGQVITVTFDHTKTPGTSTFKGFQDLSLGGVLGTDFTVSPNVTITSGPTLSAPVGQDVWSYTFTVDFSGTATDTGYVQFVSTLSAGAHYFTGSSLTLGGSPSLGNLQIHVPAAKPGSPDLSVTKTGPAATTRTSPLESNVAVCERRGKFMLPVSLHTPVAGS